MDTKRCLDHVGLNAILFKHCFNTTTVFLSFLLKRCIEKAVEKVY